MSECTHDCSTCGLNCPSKQQEQKPVNEFAAPMNSLSNVKKVYGIVSGKGGVGKSLVTSTLAVNARRRGYETAVLDADITGPSIPRAFGITEECEAMDENNILPAVTKTGIKLMSINLLLEDVTSPVIWRGPVLAGTVKQFWSDVVWGDVDYMFVDMPPGTGDVPLTVFQSLPLDGIIIVTSPQELVGMIVEKAVKMANMMNIPIVGIVENMSYFVCEKCGEKHYPFGKSNLEEIANKYGIKNIARLPITPDLAKQADRGLIELHELELLDAMSDQL